ncbi:MAG: hypothetical protein ABR66_06530 [Microbacteriaceae bacterium BACL25 MAG-120322-bin65]|nr:MAG: hypothetical protein ABR66_06530 [Microbacteriaceae bacterium BACL25 MAG-120322-bin65]
MTQVMKFAAAQSAGSVILALGLLLSGCSSNENPSTAPTAAPEEEETAMAALDTCQKVAAGYIVQIPDGEFDVCPMESHYAPSQGTLTKIPSATAEFGLSGFGPDFTDSAVSLNHPASGASDGTSLAIADRFNNRVLVFSSLPTAPTEPDVVIGQPDFQDITPGTGLADLNWPGAVEVTPEGTLLIADTENGRILVYKSLPKSHGQPADFALDLAALTGNTDAWPWGIWSDGESLVVTDTRKGYVLVWDSFPTDENSAPTSSSDPEGVGTPRNITSDGSSFLIGDENGSQPTCWGEPTANRNRQSHIWVNRLPIGAPDGCIWDWYQGDVSERGVIALAAGGQDAHFWPSFPVDNDTALQRQTTGSQNTPMGPPDGEQPDAPGEEPPSPGEPQAQIGESTIRTVGNMPQAPAHSYLGGDGGDVVITDTAIYFVEYNGNRVTGWNQFPSAFEGKAPDFSVFDSDPDVSTLLRDGYIQNPVLANADGALVASSDYDRRMYVWNEAPGENGAQADYVYLTGFPAWDNTYAQGTLIIAGRDSLAIWRDFAPGNLPDEVIRGQLGTLALSDLKGVAFDGTYLAVSEPQSDTVAVFEGIPDVGEEPIRSYSVRGPGRLDMKDGLLAIAPKEGASVLLVDVTSADEPRELRVRVNLPNQAKFLPFGFAIADTSFHRVQIWDSVDDALNGAEPARIIGGDLGDRPQTRADRFYFPASVEAVAGHLYVAEFKFSNRILAFSE